MKTIIKIQLVLISLCLLPGLQAQVTIGIDELPAEGALLQLKDIAKAAGDSKNADKGLLIPRVSLVNYTTLEPLIHNASEAKKKEHTGLIVYNLTENEYMKSGIMIWNGIEWDNIKSDEMTEDSKDMVVVKNLYKSLVPDPKNAVSANSIEVSMRKGTISEYYAYPTFRVTPSHSPKESDILKYEYLITQYWQNSASEGYSNDLESRTFNSKTYSTYQDIISSDMSPEERNEVWMYDEKNGEIFHIQFFVMGKKETKAEKIYATLIEVF